MGEPINDLLMAREAARLGPDFEQPLTDIRYYLRFRDTHRPHRMEVAKIVVTQRLARQSFGGALSMERLVGYEYDNPEKSVTLDMPYPTFRTVRELKEYYRTMIEHL